MIKNFGAGLVIPRCRPYIEGMHPLLIIGLALTAIGVIASASNSDGKNKPQQQGGEPSPDQNPPESQDEAVLELLEDDEAMEEIFTKLPELQKHLPAISPDSPDMESARQDIKDMLQKYPHELAAALEPFAMKMSWLYKDEGNDAKAERWHNLAKELWSIGKNKPR